MPDSTRAIESKNVQITPVRLLDNFDFRNGRNAEHRAARRQMAALLPGNARRSNWSRV
jgi:hypothetical protein